MVGNKVIAVIPARSGSKRIPKKNIVSFFDKPLIAWTIIAAVESNCFDRIVVSTDSLEIKSIAEQYGAEVPFLRDRYADDNSPVSLVTIDCLERLGLYNHDHYDRAVQLMPNCPLRRAEHIVSSLNNFEEKNVNFQISCFQFGWMNPWWAAKLDSTGCPEPIYPGALQKRSQDLPALYCPTGAIWVAKIKALMKAGTYYGEGHIYCPMPWEAALDIDDLHDLKMAKCLFSEKI